MIMYLQIKQFNICSSCHILREIEFFLLVTDQWEVQDWEGVYSKKHPIYRRKKAENS